MASMIILPFCCPSATALSHVNSSHSLCINWRIFGDKKQAARHANAMIVNVPTATIKQDFIVRFFTFAGFDDFQLNCPGTAQSTTPPPALCDCWCTLTAGSYLAASHRQESSAIHVPDTGR